MKLKNRRTGEIGEYIPGTGLAFIVRVYAVRSGDTPFVDYQHNSLAELYNEWEDAPEEPKEHWAIGQFGEPINVTWLSGLQLEKLHRLGNDFPSENATIEAIEKLEAWTRLKDKGFRFTGLGVDHYEIDDIKYEMEEPPTTHDCQEMKDLKLLFGGEE